MVTSNRVASATRRSRTVWAAVSTAFRAAASPASLLVPITSVTRYTLSLMASPRVDCRPAGLPRDPRAPAGVCQAPVARRPAPRLAPAAVRGVARHLRHHPPPRPGAGEDRAGARAGGARVPACGAPAERARVGDAAAAGAERERRD